MLNYIRNKGFGMTQEELAIKSGVGLNFVCNTDISMLDRMLPSIQKDWESPESYEEVVT